MFPYQQKKEKEALKFVIPFGERTEDFMNAWQVIDIKPKKENTVGATKGPGQAT